MKIDPNSFPGINPEVNQQSNLKPLDQANKSLVDPAAANDLSAAQSLLGIRGQSPEQQTQAFAQMSLQAAELALSSIFGMPVKFALDALAGTGEGKRVVQAAGHALEQTYQAQKALFQGDVAGAVNAFEGGSSHQQRESTFFAAVTSRIQQLQTQGGTLTAQDVAGFKQAIAYGDIHPLGTDALDLSKLDLVVGTNPFGPTEVGDGDASTANLLSRANLS